VHRQLGLVLDGEQARAATQGAALEALSASSSQREREAVSAERAMLDLKRAEFMLDHLLEPEPAMIVSVAPFGFFVELEAYPVEGLVRADDLPVQVSFDDATQSLVARRSGERFRLGDRVLVEATEVSLARRQVTFGLLERLTHGEPLPKVGRSARPERRSVVERVERRTARTKQVGSVKERADSKAEKTKKGKRGVSQLKARKRAKIGKRRKPSR